MTMAGVFRECGEPASLTSVRRFIAVMGLVVAAVGVVGNHEALAEEAREEEQKEAGVGLVPLPVFGLAPETGVILGALGIAHYQPENLELHQQVLRTELIFSTTGMFDINAGTELYFLEDRFFVATGGGRKHFPGVFHGVGNDTRLSDAEDYIADTWRFDVAPMVAPFTYIFAGLTFAARFEEVSDVEPGGLLDSGLYPGSDGGRDVGLGIAAKYDTRDYSMNPTGGEHFSLNARRHDEALGSEFEYWRLEASVAKYFPVVADHVLATQVYSVFAFGDQPQFSLARLGGWRHLRGHYEGRYRDRMMLDVQAEYRAPIVWRIGAVAFGGIGDVAHNLHDFFSHGLKFSVGGGLRFMVDRQGRVNVSGDYGYGGVGSGEFYIDAGEAL